VGGVVSAHRVFASDLGERLKIRAAPISAADRRRWTNPRKGGPSAPASGGFGLDEAPFLSISRRREVDGRAWPDQGLAAPQPQQRSSKELPIFEDTSPQAIDVPPQEARPLNIADHPSARRCRSAFALASASRDARTRFHPPSNGL